MFRKPKKGSSKIVKRKERNYRITDDGMIENLMRYYKLENPDALLKYIKMHHLNKDEHYVTKK